MKLWAKNRVAYGLLIIAIVSAILSLPGSTFFVAFPNLTGGPGFAAPLSALLPLVPTVALCAGINRQNMVLEATAIRRIWWADIGLMVLCLVPFAVLVALQPTTTLWESFRNALGYFGLAMLAVRLIGSSLAALIPLVWALAGLVGLLPLYEHFFNWPMAPASALESWFFPSVLALAGVLVYQYYHLANLQR